MAIVVGPGRTHLGRGGFALTMMLESSMLARVLSQPSLPLDDPARVDLTADELAAVRRRLDAEDLTALAYRFDGDTYCTAQRFRAYQDALGDRFVARVLPDGAANPDPPPFFRYVVGAPHSVVTAHLIDQDRKRHRRRRTRLAPPDVSATNRRLWARPGGDRVSPNARTYRHGASPRCACLRLRVDAATGS